MPHVVVGQLVKIAHNIHRITAPNPGVMTGPGTNTYLLGCKSIAVIDPGPLLQPHLDAIMAGAAELGGQISHIVVTHTHMDHSPAAAPLAQLTGAKLVGKAHSEAQFQDTSFIPDIELFNGYELVTDEYNLHAIHTPGHVGNHYCLLEQSQQLLFTGDHIMNGSTVVVVPPSGDMAAYIDSLRLLLDYSIAHLAPAHGDIMVSPETVINGLIAHRLQREQKVIAALSTVGISTIDDLVPVVYADVSQDMHGVAYFSLWAHLEKLLKDGRVLQRDNLWQNV